METTKLIFLVLFVGWGIPLSWYRSKFRKIVYQDSHWTINIKPYFIRELRGLFGNLYPANEEYIKMRNFYRKYLLVYTVLFILYLVVG
jgi:peroxiredoxin Q/BCP